jgi:hypothetical protein
MSIGFCSSSIGSNVSPKSGSIHSTRVQGHDAVVKARGAVLVLAYQQRLEADLSTSVVWDSGADEGRYWRVAAYRKATSDRWTTSGERGN